MGSKRGLIRGVGVNDVGYVVEKRERVHNGKTVKHKLVWRCPFYDKWKSMLERCYSKDIHERQPTYKNCNVCEEWLTLSNFKSWMETQDWEGKHLDKDLIDPYNKVYCPEKCLFIPSAVNLFIRSNININIRGKYLIGTYWRKDANIFQAQCKNPFTRSQENLGYFTSEFSAHKAWQKRKLELAIQLGDLPENKHIRELLIKRYTFEEDEICDY